jgi:hypothetical protein
MNCDLMDLYATARIAGITHAGARRLRTTTRFFLSLWLARFIM